MMGIIDLFLHIDKHLDELVTAYGTLTYVVLLVVVFCETGLVVTPFLPGDSLLFAAGAIAARGTLSPTVLIVGLSVAAIVGDAVNYSVGKRLGPKALQNPNSRIFKRAYLERTEQYFARYGGKTIIFARFIPIVRTFAPFLAGVGSMSYARFAAFNVVGGITWVVAFVLAGYFFGEIPVVKQNFTLVILGIIGVSCLPAAIEFWRERGRP